MASESSSFKSPIPQLTDDNYPEWLVDIKALLRKQKLWKYTQEPPPESLSNAALAKWKESSTDAADVITPTVSGPAKKKVQTNAFDCGFTMMTELATIYAPKGDAEFMRLTREYYSLRFEEFDSMTHYLTHIKTLEERIRNTNVVLDDDKRTLVCLGMTLPEEYQYFTKIWTVTPGMTADKARNMLLEEERRRKALDPGAVGIGTVGLVARTRYEKAKREKFPETYQEGGQRRNVQCSRCGKPHEDEICWRLHPELAPEWLQERWTIEKRSRKRKWEELQQQGEGPDEKEAFVNL